MRFIVKCTRSTSRSKIMRRIYVLFLFLSIAIGISAQFSQKDFKQLCKEMSPQEAASTLKNIRMMWAFEAEQNYSSAASLGLAAYEAIRKSKGESTKSKGYATLVDHLALDLSNVGHTPEALYLGRESVLLWKDLSGEHSAKYVNAISNLATFYLQQNDRIRAELVLDKGLNLCANDKKLRTSFAELLNTKMVIHLSSGQTDRALATYKELSELSLTMKDDWVENYILALFSKGEYALALDNQRTLLAKAEKSKDVCGRKRARYQYKLSYYLTKTGKYEEAESYLESAIDYYRANASTLNDDYARCLSLFSSIDQRKGRYEAAINKERRCVDILKRLLPVNAPQLLNAQQHLVDLQFRYGDRAEALHSLYTCTRQDMFNMKYSMSTTHDVRTGIWASSNTWYTNSLPYFASECRDDSLLMLAYDGTLLAKGLLLNVDSNIADEVSRGDSLLQHLYADWMSSKNSLDAAQTLKAFQCAKVLSEQKENLFMHYYRQVSTAHEWLNVTWNQVESVLSSDAMAVEFVAYPYDESYVYAALILKNGMKHPEMTVLCTEEELLSACQHQNIATLLFEKFMPYTKGISKIYFSPIRKLYDIPLESMFVSKIPQCKYSLYRVSSTRNLAISKMPKVKERKAVIFGGIDYDACFVSDRDVVDTQAREHTINEQETIAALRGAENSFPYLKGTLEEANSIGKTLNGQAQIMLALGKDGTEATFRDFASKGITILHIGTHGFYVEKVNDDEYYWLPLFCDENKNLRDKEDEALSRSGLLLAGAANTINGEEKALEKDGILTAQEISILDFHGLDLVTLSACETAKGDITGDGIFGLQRGFKKAGANSILMSLWKVDDEATCKLMTEFYSNWITHKMTKHDALEAAKHTIRETPGWEDPKFWAAFIMLDALD